jgi:hypothetical protein
MNQASADPNGELQGGPRPTTRANGSAIKVRSLAIRLIILHFLLLLRLIFNSNNVINTLGCVTILETSSQLTHIFIHYGDFNNNNHPPTTEKDS